VKKRLFSGVQPSGRLHIGNLLGAIANWIKLQEEYDAIFGIVDYHAMTVEYNPKEMPERIVNTAIDYIACGIDPQKSIIMVQSEVKEHVELAWILSTVTPLAWLQRIPTFKEKVKQQPHNVNVGLFNYPMLMASDILIYRSEVVPVGEDQVPHIEFTREVARRFNNRFGKFFPEPEALIGRGARVLGLDGINKMSKSLNNAIYLDDPPDVVWEKVAKQGVTDPARKKRTDPGNPEVCNLYSWHKLFSSQEEIRYVAEQCKNAGFGCLDCKRILVNNMIKVLAPIQEKQKELRNNRKKVIEILISGTEKAKKIAQETMQEVKRLTGLYI